jgi:hypothetical protein
MIPITTINTTEPIGPLPVNPQWRLRGLFCFVVARFSLELAQQRLITFTGTPGPLPSVAGYGYNCGTVSNYATVSSVTELASPREWSAVALIRSDTNSTDNVIANVNYDGTTVPLMFALGRSAGFGSGSGVFSGSWSASGFSNVGIVGDGNLHTVGAVFLASTRMELWIDGAIDSSTTPTSDPSGHTNTNALNIGTYLNNSSTFIGRIFAVGIFNKALSNAEMHLLTQSQHSIWQLAAPTRKRYAFQPTTQVVPFVPYQWWHDSGGGAMGAILAQ